MTPHERLHHVWSTMNEALSSFGPVYLAGGAVRDTLMGRPPKDYDVFVIGVSFGDTSDDYEALLLTVADRLKGWPEAKVQVEHHKSEPFLVKSITLDGVEVQVMVSPQPTVDALIDTFDWSVCLFAYGAQGYVTRGDVSLIKPGGELTLNRCTFPYSTLRRGYRFSERFLMKLASKDVLSIATMIVDGARKALPDWG